MKTIVLTIALLLSVTSTKALACSDYLLAQAVRAKETVDMAYETGRVNVVDVLSAQKNVLEVKLCSVSKDLKIFENASVVKELRQNLSERIEVTKVEIQIGLRDPMYMAHLEGEKQTLAKTCNAILTKAEKVHDVGLISETQYKEMQEACSAR